MAKKLRSGIINGCLNRVVVKLYLLERVLLWFGLVSYFIQILESGIRVNWLLVFLPWEAKKVGGIYVGEDEAEDVLIWPLSSSRSYSVRSAYRMLMEADNSVLPSSSSPLSVHRIWKKIWKLKVPKKVCHFLWRAMKDSLPTKQNLRLQHIQIDDMCEGCNDQSESLLHCLWLCDQARFVWLSDPGFLFLTQKNSRSFLEILETLFSAGSGFRCAQFAMTAWCLWERQNHLRVHQRT